MNDWVRELERLGRDARPAVLVTVASIKGSAPREAGTKMIVTAGATHGTIGGGHLEHQAIAIARDMIASGAAGGELRRFPLGASLGQCCGGLVNLLFEPVIGAAEWVGALETLRREGKPCVLVTALHGPAQTGKLIVTQERVIGSLADDLAAQAAEVARELLARGSGARLERLGTAEGPMLLLFEAQRTPDFHIVLFGAGHVGRALVHVLSGMPCRITWVDGRDGEFPREVQGNVTIACTDVPTAEVAAAPAGSYFLVMTHSHALDQELAEAILARDDFAYFGLIGSASKRRQFEKRMAARGVPPARFADMTCPIGVAGIKDKAPATIAIAVAAELLQTRECRAAAQAAPAQQVRRA